MAENKTKPTDASVEEYSLSGQRGTARGLQGADVHLQENHQAAAKDVGPEHCRLRLLPLHLRERKNREICLAGFAIRGRELVVYLVAEGREQEALLSKLGKHRMGKSCLYFKRLANLDKTVLEALVAKTRC
jgi:hypothetical protein